MYHSITIGTKNTWDDWKLIPLSRPLVNPPQVNTKFVEVPGYNGTVDMTTVLNGKPTYSRRTGEWKFMVTHDYAGYNWIDVYNAILGYLHGSLLTVTLEDEPDWHYTGRLHLGSWESGANYSTATIGYELLPFKYTSTTITRSFRNSDSISIIGGKTLTVPTITISNGMMISYNGQDVTFEEAGTYAPAELAIVEGTKTMVFTGTGTAIVSYRRTEL